MAKLIFCVNGFSLCFLTFHCSNFLNNGFLFVLWLQKSLFKDFSHLHLGPSKLFWFRISKTNAPVEVCMSQSSSTLRLFLSLSHSQRVWPQEAHIHNPSLAHSPAITGAALLPGAMRLGPKYIYLSLGVEDKLGWASSQKKKKRSKSLL